MKTDEMLPGRRVLLRGAALFALAATAGCAGTERSGAPSRPSNSPGPAAGAQAAARPQKPSAYRLQPMTGYGPQRGAVGRTPVRSKPILRMAERGRDMVLTFDDGPDPLYTPDILKTLRKNDVRAMFFVCGEMAESNPDLLRRMIDEGHTIGNHTFTHPQLTRMRRTKIRDEIGRTSDAVLDTVGQPPLWFRAPYGAWNRSTFEIGAELGMEPLAWTVDTLDWQEPGTDKIIRSVLRGAGPGVVVLSHDAGGNRSQTVKALRNYLPRLLDEGYRIGVPSRALM